MNPCPCGHAGDAAAPCTCLPDAVERYHARLSGPLMDRIDLRVHVPRLAYEELRDQGREPTRVVRERVLAARERMRARLAGTGRRTNAELTVAEVRRFCSVDTGAEGLAQGIDTAAHRGALDGGGRTVAVLGESIASFVATVSGRRRPLVPRIRANGALVSEYAAPLSARGWMFAQRDATIAALAALVV